MVIGAPGVVSRFRRVVHSGIGLGGWMGGVWGSVGDYPSIPCAGGEVAGGNENMWTLVVEIYSALRKHQVIS